MNTLRPRQLETLEALLHFHEVQGHYPSIRQLGKVLGRSESSVLARLRSLEAAGVIRRVPGQPRAIQLLVATSPP